jgi:uncharacterized membrane protein
MTPEQTERARELRALEQREFAKSISEDSIVQARWHADNAAKYRAQRIALTRREGVGS